MIWIYEGADLVGKTTLAKNFAKEHDIPLIKKRLDVFNHTTDEFLRGSNIELTTQMFFESIYPLGVKYDFVLDRGLLSSLVYSKFFNRDVKIDYIYDYLLTTKSDFLIINLITANEESIKSRLQTRGEKIFGLKEILEIQDLYIKTAKILNEKGGPRTIINFIENNNE
jgi:thymidylate kinase